MKPVLIIEDDDDAWFSLRNILIDIGYPEAQLKRFSSIPQLIASYETEAELIITDLKLATSLSEAPIEILCKQFPSSPIIVVTNNPEDETALKSLNHGAQDYLIRGEIDKRSLSKSIQYAVERKRHDNDYKQLFKRNPVPMYIFNETSLRILAINDAASHQYGYSEEEFLNLTALDLRPGHMIEAFKAHVNSHPSHYYDAGNWLHKRKDGSEFYVHIYAHQVVFEGASSRMVVAVDIDKAVRTERKLDKKVKEVERILESMTNAFFTVNANHEFTYVNKEFERILRQNREQVLGRNIWDAFPEAVTLKFYQGYYEAVNKDINVFFEEYLPTLDIWLSVKAYPLNNGLAVYFIDITEQRKAQQKIREEEQNLRAIINNTNDIIWSTDRQYRIISANEAFWKHLELLTGKYKQDLNEADFGREAFSQWASYFDRALAGDSYKMVWEENLGGTKQYAEISFNPIRNDQGEVTGISCFSRDITAERHLQEKIKTDDLNLKAMIDNTEDLIWSIDSEMNLITANHSYLKTVRALVGGEPSTGRSVIDHRFGEVYVQQWQEYYRRGLSGEYFIIELEMDINGVMMYSETRFNPIFDSNGIVVGVSCFTRDITEPRQYRQRIERQNEELKEIAWLQSHKVRSHVATILGLTDLINYTKTEDEVNLQILNGIRESSEELDKVIREINKRTHLIGGNDTA